MLQMLRKVLFFLYLDDRKKLYRLIIAIIIMSFFDMMGVVSVLPFLSVVSDDQAIQTHHQLKWLYDTLGFTSRNSFLIALGAVSFFILLAGNVLRAVTTRALIWFTWMKHYSISKRLLTQYLYEPYAFFLNRNSSELTTYLMSEVARVVSGALIPCMQVFARVLLVLFICVSLLLVDPLGVILVLGFIGGGYTVIYYFFRNKLFKTGKERQEYSKSMYKTLHEAFGGIKEIKLLGKEHIFVQHYAGPAKKVINCYCAQFLIAQLPRYAFEVITFAGILIVVLYFVVVKNYYQQIVPLVGLYTLAAYRLMPAFQQVFQDVTSIRSSRTALDTVYKDFIECTNKNYKLVDATAYVLSFSKSIGLRNVTFQYPQAQKPVIDNFNLVIKTNMTVGFVGGTGAGKTTLVDIFLGLLRPQKGDLVVDGVVIKEENLRRWQANIGYVPQHIYLCDDTVTRNIALGIPDNEIDKEAVERAAQSANIHDFIVEELPHGYATEVGERGVRLSGGQRQRIGIARALYRNPSLLVFDEATSALDGITEDTILEAIHNLAHKKTIIIIAHRLSTVKECDVIYLLEQGRIVDQGTYQKLLANNQQFRKMAKVYDKDHDLSQSLADAVE